VTTYEVRLPFSDELPMDPRRLSYAPVSNSTASIYIAVAKRNPACRHLEELKVTSFLLVVVNVSSCEDAEQLGLACGSGATS